MNGLRSGTACPALDKLGLSAQALSATCGRIKTQVPLGRMGARRRNCANAALYLASGWVQLRPRQRTARVDGGIAEIL